jgi:predicted DNA-binding protein (MmcQ/YjbR family)
LRRLLRSAYELVVAKLPRKKREELHAAAPARKKR